MDANQPDLEALAQTCLQEAKTIKTHLAANSLGDLGFSPTALPSFPKTDAQTQQARTNLRNAAKTLYDLTTGPQEGLTELSLTSLQFIGSVRYLLHFKIPDSVPQDSPISYSALASTTSVSISQLKQILRFAITNHIFLSPTPDTVSHSASSLLLLSTSPMAPIIHWLTYDCAPMLAGQVGAIEKWGHGSQEQNQTAVNYAYDFDGSFYDFISADEGREKRFGTTIQRASEQPASSVKHVAEGFDWSVLGNGSLVDVGGHIGFCGVAIAQAAEGLKVVVQERPEVVAMALDPTTAVVPADVKERVEFEVHDFFTPQKREADAYFLRKTLLNFTDEYAKRIVAALSPALRKGNRLLIMDFVLVEKAVEATVMERYSRAVDLQMLLYYNCRYRTLDEWKALVKAGDERFEFEGEYRSPGSSMPILSFVVR
ncbi:uncharacterized protein KY384_009227 [Bacidia gigantensis]|uniref:uncharacterized protein n=1 Tax=Bacidia gigantensis TaxID=2732470 RepID=UPI001D0565F3|nr:uncharacterized protein KY384_009227 [Bacidia gigantensis]KAG8525583.1 hypothetical protein KY384_009227 [Bacidia gigantensis]